MGRWEEVIFDQILIQQAVSGKSQPSHIFSHCKYSSITYLSSCIKVQFGNVASRIMTGERRWWEVLPRRKIAKYPWEMQYCLVPSITQHSNSSGVSLSQKIHPGLNWTCPEFHNKVFEISSVTMELKQDAASLSDCDNKQRINDGKFTNLTQVLFNFLHIVPFILSMTGIFALCLLWWVAKCS